MSKATGLYTCPLCALSIHFRNGQTTLNTCTCNNGSAVKLLENDMLVSKPYAVIKTADTIIQPGTEGKWKGTAFTVLGRFRTWQQETVFNYWTIAFHNGKMAYLAEAYGLYAIYEKAEPTISLGNEILSNRNQHKLALRNTTSAYYQQRYAAVYKWEIEGEVWMPYADDQFEIFDYQEEDGSSIVFFKLSRQTTLAFKAETVDFDALELDRLRVINTNYSITCEECKNKIPLQTFPYAQSCACARCDSRYSYKENAPWVHYKVRQKEYSGAIPIGAKGKLMDTDYQVIGFVVKKEAPGDEHSTWKEYTLYNPSKGFAFLSEYAGHWIFLQETLDGPLLKPENTKSIYWKRENFDLYNKYSFHVIECRGEFPGNAFNDGNTVAREFISPPEMLIYEKNALEGLTLFHGQHIEKSDVANAFGISAPHQTGVGAVQPKGYINQRKIIVTTLVGMVILLIIHALMGNMSANKTIVAGTYFFDQPVADSTRIDSTSLPVHEFTVITAPVEVNNKSVTVPKFELKKWRSNLAVNISAPVDNSWFELGVTLTNTATGEEFSIHQGVEYYKGYSDGESWSEGGRDETAYLSSIPSGTYVLEINALRESGKDLHDFSIEIVNDTTMSRNIWIAVILMLIWPVFKIISVSFNEKNRWQNSPFSSYSHED